MIPPDVFPPELQPLIYLVIFPTIAILLPIIFLIFWKFLIPESSKEEIKARIDKSILVNWESDAGYSVIERAKAYPEGIIVTKKTKQVFMLPRHISQTRISRVQNAEQQEKEEKKETIDYSEPEDVQRVALKRSILKGHGAPFIHAYSGKAIATNLSTLIGLEYGGESKTAKMTILKKAIKKLPGKAGWVVNVLLPVDPRATKKWFTHMWNQSQLRARDRVSEEIGYERGKGEMKRWMVPIVILMVVFIAGMIFLLLGSGKMG